MATRVDDLPLYVGEGLPQLPPQQGNLAPGGASGDIVTNPWLDLLAEQANQRWQQQRWYRHQLANPRRESRVVRHVFAPLDEVVERLRSTPWPAGLEPCSAWREREGPGDDAGWELDTKVAFRWSWPPLPARFSVRPWSAGRATMHLELGERFRVRYPRRWFLRSHELLDTVYEAAVDNDQGLTS